MEAWRKELYLAHHGILGMKWGIRRYQNPDGSLTAEGKLRYGSTTPGDEKNANKINQNIMKAAEKGERSQSLRKAHVIPKGTVMYRVTTNKDEDTSGQKYVSYIDADRQHYKSGWVRQTNNSDKAYENEYVLQKDLKVPSREEVKSVITECVGQDTIDIVQKHINMRFPKDTWERIELIDEYKSEHPDWTSKRVMDEIVNKEIDKYKNMTVNEAYFYAAQTLGLNKKLKDKVVKELTNRGYDAMVDEASVGGQNGWGKEGIAPMIVFDGSDSLYKRSSTEISREDEVQSRINYTMWRMDASLNEGEWKDRRNGSFL